MQQDFFQIYEDHRPLINQSYPSIRHANKALQNILVMQSNHGSLFGYEVENRLPFLPVRKSLALRKKYADGSTVNVSYTVRQVKLQPVYSHY